jgi:hypothetical protein
MSERIRNIVAKYSPPLTSEQVAAIIAEIEQLATSIPEQKVEIKKKGR